MMAQRYLKRYLLSLAIMEMQIKITLRFHLPQSDGQDQQNNCQKMLVTQREDLSFTVGRNANWCSNSGNQCGESSKRKNKSTIWSAKPLLGTQPNDPPSHSTHTCSGMFTVVLFTKVRKWKRPKTTFNKTFIRNMDDENMVHLYSETLFTCKKNEIMNFQGNE